MVGRNCCVPWNLAKELGQAPPTTVNQLSQNLRTGEATIVVAPVPHPARGQVVVRTRASLMSAGTERMLVNFGKSGWIGKALQQPDKVKQVLEKIATDGVMATLAAVRSK